MVKSNNTYEPLRNSWHCENFTNTAIRWGRECWNQGHSPAINGRWRNGKLKNRSPIKRINHHRIRRVSPVLGYRGVLSQKHLLMVAHLWSPSSWLTMNIARINYHTKPIVSTMTLTLPPPNGLELSCPVVQATVLSSSHNPAG